MAEEYYSDYKRYPRSRRRSVLTQLLDQFMLLVTVGVGAAMTLTLLVPFINPAKVAFFPLLGLIAPAVYLATIALALFWIIRWRWIPASALLVLVVIGSFNVSLFYRGQLRRTYGEPQYDRSAIKLMTFNVRYYYDDRGQTTADRVTRLLQQIDPDIICLQEYNARVAGESAAFTKLLEKYAQVVSDGSSAAGPMLILSKYPIIHANTSPVFESSIWADLQIGDDVVRVFNNHLHTTDIKVDDDKFITQRLYLTDSTRWAKIRSIVHRHRKNSVLRAAQVDKIAPVIASTQMRYIICGDFNDTPVSYVYRTMARGAKDAFSECGKGYSHTYRGFFNTLRIDYVLRSAGLEAVSYKVYHVNYSDHLPVVVRLQKTDHFYSYNQ